MRKFYFDFILALLFIVRLTIFQDSSAFNAVFGVGIILLLPYFYKEFYGLRIKKKSLISLSLVILLFTISVVVTVLNGHVLFMFLYDVSRYILLVGIFLFAAYLTNNYGINALIWIISSLLLFHFPIAIFQILTGQVSFVKDELRLAGFFDNTGHFGAFCGLSFIILNLYNNKKRSSLIIILMVVVLLLLAMNNTLRAIVSLLVAYMLYFLIDKKKYTLVLIIPVLFIILILFNSEVYDRLESVFNASYEIDRIIVAGTKLDNSFQWRLLQWYRLTLDWSQNFLFFGAGIGQETMLEGFKTKDGRPFIAHSDFVKVLIEVGIIGMIIIFFIVLKLYNRFKYYIVSKHSMMSTALYYVVLSGILGSTMFTTTFLLFLFIAGGIIGTVKGDLEYNVHLKT